MKIITRRHGEEEVHAEARRRKGRREEIWGRASRKDAENAGSAEKSFTQRRRGAEKRFGGRTSRFVFI